jgi:hypothetical protein
MYMKMPPVASRFIARFVSFALVLMLLPLLAVAQSASTKPITEKGLTDALKIGGLSENELITIIQTRGVDFQLTPQAEQALRAAGATDGEIAAVRANYRGASAAPAQPAPQPASPPVQTPTVASSPASLSPGIYLQNGSAWAALPVESVSWQDSEVKSILHKASGGLLNEAITGTITGSHSGTAQTAPLQILLELASGSSMQSYLLVHLHAKNDNREFKCGSGSAKCPDQVAFQATPAGNNYQINFSAGSGDYAFILRSDLPTGKGPPNPSPAFTFRIR